MLLLDDLLVSASDYRAQVASEAASVRRPPPRATAEADEIGSGITAATKPRPTDTELAMMEEAMDDLLAGKIEIEDDAE